MNKIAKLITTLLIACIIALISVQEQAWATMYGSNSPVMFQTDKGSCYLVRSKGLTRLKFDGTTHDRDGKNIFYAYTDKTSNSIWDSVQKNSDGYIVQGPHINGGPLSIKIKEKGEGDKMTYTYQLDQLPEVERVPIDMYLTGFGRADEDDRFHVGHKIVKVYNTVPLTPQLFYECANKWLKKQLEGENAMDIE